PPTDYWPVVGRPWDLRYGVDANSKYSRDGMNGVPVDDDITYTILGLLIIERYGFDFTVEQVGEIWKEILPYACTAEDVALKNLQKGIPAKEAGVVDNPYLQWIGADIRADGFGYAAAGNPEKAAQMGYVDAYLSHRRNGIYGEMFFAAAIAAAFTTNDPIEPIRVALKEIPATCALYKDVEWALEVGPTLKNFREARQAVDERFAGMSWVHTNNNACLTIFGLFLGSGDFTETIANVIAMGLDNDCTGATVGSIIGAIVGEEGIALHWTKAFNNKVRTYLVGHEELAISDVVDRFVKLAEMNMSK
ncbi:MAG: ADP-ribosylglycohydrolase family protein, partial [Firmicutes bacterium]|nr:ADP-ribosylglycohydrolase family protein [Bacillota bacterium]